MGTDMSLHPMKPQPEAGPYLSLIDLVVLRLTPVVPAPGSQLQFTAVGPRGTDMVSARVAADAGDTIAPTATVAVMATEILFGICNAFLLHGHVQPQLGMAKWNRHVQETA
ncbi:hypothetical protein VR44_32635 [Streptomyces katrae]|uniref:Uncharacterized protein n=1 Tax=Streptomyces katrae TaxID=68223 RepID=A0A0F4ITL9_9ACTN|nr:hypothetical protein VR44_32635 [Streptomyces katrae]